MLQLLLHATKNSEIVIFLQMIGTTQVFNSFDYIVLDTITVKQKQKH